MENYPRDNVDIQSLIDSKNSIVEQSKAYARDLKITVANLKTANKELHASYLETVQKLVVASEYRDDNTGDHIKRMSKTSAFIAEKKGFSKQDTENILYSSPMHDVGKIGIPDHILLKKGKLTKEEFETIKTHCTIGAQILSDSKSKILQLAESIALSHHEKWNGEGYPQGLSGKDIPIESRIAAVADVFDALLSKRPYKKPFSAEQACDIIREEKGKHFDPELVEIFLDNFDEILAIHHA